MPYEYEEPAPAPETPPAPPAPPEPPEPKGPNLDELVEQERQRRIEAEQRAEIQRQEYDQRVQTLAQVLRDRLNGQTSTPPAPAVSDEDFLTPEGARKAAARLAEEAAERAARQVDDNYRGTVTQVLQDQFDSRLETMKTRPHFKYVEKEIAEAIRKNPDIRLQPRALDILYNAYVGAKMETILKEERNAAPPEDAPGNPVRPSITDSRYMPPPAPSASQSEDQTVELSAIEEHERQKWARYGVKISREDWVASRERDQSKYHEIPDMPQRRG